MGRDIVPPLGYFLGGVLLIITLHRLGHTDESFQLTPDLIVTIESTPDTVISLTTTAKVVVSETPEEVSAAVHSWRVVVLSDAMRARRDPPESSSLPARKKNKRLSAVEPEGS